MGGATPHKEWKELTAMESVTLIRPVLVKVEVTESYKKAVAAELQEHVRQLDTEIAHLDFQEKRLTAELERKNPGALATARQQLDQERCRRVESRQKLLGQLKEIGQLLPGSEVVYAKMESPVVIGVGDRWQDVLGVEIVLKDGFVAAIRQVPGAGDAKNA